MCLCVYILGVLLSPFFYAYTFHTHHNPSEQFLLPSFMSCLIRKHSFMTREIDICIYHKECLLINVFTPLLIDKSSHVSNFFIFIHNFLRFSFFLFIVIHHHCSVERANIMPEI